MVCPKTHNRRHSSSVKAVGDLPKFSEKEIKEIENFQQRLVQLGFLAKDSFKKGVFDDSTKKATQSFQKAFKTEKQDGTLDQKTLEIAEKAEKDKSIEPGIFGYPSFTSQDTISVDASTGWLSSCNTGITSKHVVGSFWNGTTLIKKDENGNFSVMDTPTIVIPIEKSGERIPDIAFSLPVNKGKSNIAQCPWLQDEKISNVLENKEPIFISTYRNDEVRNDPLLRLPQRIKVEGMDKNSEIVNNEGFSLNSSTTKVYPVNLKIADSRFTSSNISGVPRSLNVLIPPREDGKFNPNLLAGASGSPSYIVLPDGKKQVLGVYKGGVTDWESFVYNMVKRPLLGEASKDLVNYISTSLKNQFQQVKETLNKEDQDFVLKVISKLDKGEPMSSNRDPSSVCKLIFKGEKPQDFEDLLDNYPPLLKAIEEVSKQVVLEAEILYKKYPNDFEKISPILNDSSLSYTQKWQEIMKTGCELRIIEPISKETVNGILQDDEVREIESKLENKVEEYKSKLENFFKNSLAGLGL